MPRKTTKSRSRSRKREESPPRRRAPRKKKSEVIRERIKRKSKTPSEGLCFSNYDEVKQFYESRNEPKPIPPPPAVIGPPPRTPMNVKLTAYQHLARMLNETKGTNVPIPTPPPSMQARTKEEKLKLLDYARKMRNLYAVVDKNLAENNKVLEMRQGRPFLVDTTFGLESGKMSARPFEIPGVDLVSFNTPKLSPWNNNNSEDNPSPDLMDLKMREAIEKQNYYREKAQEYVRNYPGSEDEKRDLKLKEAMEKSRKRREEMMQRPIPSLDPTWMRPPDDEMREKMRNYRGTKEKNEFEDTIPEAPPLIFPSKPLPKPPRISKPLPPIPVAAKEIKEMEQKFESEGLDLEERKRLKRLKKEEDRKLAAKYQEEAKAAIPTFLGLSNPFTSYNADIPKAPAGPKGEWWKPGQMKMPKKVQAKYYNDYLERREKKDVDRMYRTRDKKLQDSLRKTREAEEKRKQAVLNPPKPGFLKNMWSYMTAVPDEDQLM